MMIIVGLGNPGGEYALTRHNAGVMLVDKIYDLKFKNHEYGWRRKNKIMIYETKDLVLLKTAKYFMNESGSIIHDLRYTKYDLKDVRIAHDDLDLRLGEFKIQFGKGPKVHNGVESIEHAMGTKDFMRIRIGIDNRETGNREDGESYVLQGFDQEELTQLDEALARIADEISKTTD